SLTALPSNVVMISPPTRPALSAGPPGGSTSLKVTPLSTASKSSTPAYDRVIEAVIEVRGELFFRPKLIKPPIPNNPTNTIQSHVVPNPIRRRRLNLPPDC